MDAIILAAGFATRLRPLSFVRPKVLVPICGRPLLDIMLRQLSVSGFKHVHINTHHLPEQLETFLQKQKYPLDIKIYHEEKILGTGGGIYRMASDVVDKKAQILVLNGDILAGLDLEFLCEYHSKSGGAVTMVMVDSSTFNNVLVDADFSILAFGEKAKRLVDGVSGSRLMTFTGIHVVNREIIAKYSPRRDFFSIIDTYENAISAGEKVKAVFLPRMPWQEVGSIAGYWEAHMRIKEKPDIFSPWLTEVKFPIVDVTATIHRGTQMEGIVCIGKSCRIDSGVRLRDVIIWDWVHIKKDAELTNVIVCDHCTVENSAKDTILLNAR